MQEGTYTYLKQQVENDNYTISVHTSTEAKNSLSFCLCGGENDDHIDREGSSSEKL